MPSKIKCQSERKLKTSLALHKFRFIMIENFSLNMSFHPCLVELFKNQLILMILISYKPKSNLYKTLNKRLSLKQLILALNLKALKRSDNRTKQQSKPESERE